MKEAEAADGHLRRRFLPLVCLALAISVIATLRSSRVLRRSGTFDTTLESSSSNSPETLASAVPPPNATSNSFERHCLSTYRSMMVRREIPTKFVLFRLPTHGFGNKIRSLSGAVFLAALTDRVLLVDTTAVTALFDPPAVDGVVLDWDPGLAGGACDGGDGAKGGGGSVAHVPASYDVDSFVNFADRYGDNVTCIVVTASFGHDRQVAALNADAFRDKVTRLFGHPTSRYNWSYQCLRLALQRPKEVLREAGRAAMERIGLDVVPPERRIAVQVRGWFDTPKPAWRLGVLRKKEGIFDRVERLVGERVAELGGEGVEVTVLFVSDRPDLNAEGMQRLVHVSGVKEVILPENPVIHTEVVGNETTSEISSFLDWFLLGECSAVVAAGYSSFGLTAFFRPSTFPPTLDFSSKRLYTFGLGYEKGWMKSWNSECGKVLSEGYMDVTFGIGDPEPAMIKEAVAERGEDQNI